MTRLRGAIAAAVTPLREGGRALDLEGVGPLVSFLAHGGVDGALVCGTTGEGVLLSVVERRRVAEAFLAARPDGFRIAVHAGAQTTHDTIALSAHALRAGADAVAVIALPYFPLGPTELFDHLVVSTGHFSTPNVPQFPGVEMFPGRVLHAHDFRDAREFTGKNLLVIGSSYSAEDIALQCHKYGARSVTISYRTRPMGFHWPESMKEVPLLERLEGKTAHFKDGSTAEVDAVILCTGYQHHFPFLDNGLRLETHNRLYPPGLYKGVVWQKNPRLLYLGMQDQYYTFSMFDAQAWFARDVILGRIGLPGDNAMAQDIADWVAREEGLENPYQAIDFQTDYVRDLCALVDYPKFDLELARKHFYDWEHDKEASIVGYRDKSFTSPCTGTTAPVHHAPWLQAMDDSMADFLRAG